MTEMTVFFLGRLLPGQTSSYSVFLVSSGLQKLHVRVRTDFMLMKEVTSSDGHSPKHIALGTVIAWQPSTISVRLYLKTWHSSLFIEVKDEGRFLHDVVVMEKMRSRDNAINIVCPALDSIFLLLLLLLFL